MLTVLDRKLDKICNFCEKKKSIYMYGAGNRAKAVNGWLRERNIVLEGILVSDGHKDKELFEGIRVYSLEEKKSDIKEAAILVAVEDYEEILFSLKSCLVPEENIFLCFERAYPSTETFYQGDREDGPYFQEFTELFRWGDLCEADKGRSKGKGPSGSSHNYLHKYEFFISPWRDKEFTLLELGVRFGASLRMWEKYFSKAKVIGVDIDANCKNYEGERKEVIIEDIGWEENIDKLIKKISMPSIIIDDASHQYSHQIKGLIKLFPQLHSGGIYIIEDLYTSFGACRGTVFDDAVINTFEFCCGIAEAHVGFLNIENNQRLAKFQNEILEIAKDLDMISFIHGACIMVKH